MNIFTLLTPITYWLLVVLWLFVIIFYFRRLFSKRIISPLTRLLLVVLAIDAFRTLFESCYFGAWYTSLAGFIPREIHNVLVRPELVIIPKLTNVFAVTVVLFILLRRWFPQEEQEKAQLNALVQEQISELIEINNKLRIEITERKRAEEALRRSAEEIQDLYDYAPCGYHSLDSNGMFIRINETELHWLGYAREEIIGKKRFSDLVTGKYIQTFGENFPRFLEQGWVRDLEFEIVRKDGSILPVLLTATALYDDDGNFVMSRSTIYDVTERRKAEEKEHLLSAIVQSSDDAIFAKEMNGVILSWNKGAERIYGYSAEEIVGKSVSVLVPPDYPDELAEIMAHLRQGERIEHYTTERIRKDGQRISISLAVSPILNREGNILGASSIGRDITEQMRIEKEVLKLNEELEQRVAIRTHELEKSQKALMNIVEDLNDKTEELEKANAKLKDLDRLKSMFIASMSHELRTPLNSIIGFSSILHDEWLGSVNREQKENLAIILKSGRHLLNLINDVIDVSKIEAGKIESFPEEFDLRDLVNDAVNLIKKELEKKGVVLRVSSTSKLMFTDRRRLLQCLLNLLTNAVKYSEQGVVTVETRIVDSPQEFLEKDVAEISVTDTGIGIREEDLGKMFQPFVRLASPLQSTVPGTGLGLYLTRKLVAEVLSGDILLTSKYGRGSRFTIRIPAKIS